MVLADDQTAVIFSSSQQLLKLQESLQHAGPNRESMVQVRVRNMNCNGTQQMTAYAVETVQNVQVPQKQ